MSYIDVTLGGSLTGFGTREIRRDLGPVTWSTQPWEEAAMFADALEQVAAEIRRTFPAAVSDGA